MNDKEVFEKYRIGKGKTDALEVMPYETMIQELEGILPDYEKDTSEFKPAGGNKSYRLHTSAKK